MQILEVIQSLCERMPKEVLDEQAEIMVFTLMLRTVNENNKNCRDKVSAVLKKLLQKISPSKSKTIFNTIIQMNSQDKSKKLII